MNIVLVDIDEEMYTIWNSHFGKKNYKDVLIRNDSMESVMSKMRKDTKVILGVMGNCYGIMKKGVVGVVADIFEKTKLEERVKEKILNWWMAEQPINTCSITHASDDIYIAYSPIRKLDIDDINFENVYFAARNILIKSHRINKKTPVSTVMFFGPGEKHSIKTKKKYCQAISNAYHSYKFWLENKKPIDWDYVMKMNKYINDEEK